MKCCLEIIVVDSENVPIEYLDNGILRFDMSEGVSINTNIEAVTEYDKLTGISSKEITIYGTQKNNYILEYYRTISVVRKDELTIPVQARLNGELLPFTELIVSGSITKNKDVVSYNCKLSNKKTNWKEVSKDLLLADIDLGQFTFTNANVIASWASGNAHIYDDEDSGVYFSHIDFGESNTIDITNLRPLISPLHVLRAGFCHLGYKFSSPILESNYMRDIWCYLLANNIGVYDDIGGDYAVIAEGNSNELFFEDPLNTETHIVQFPITVQDNGNLWDGTFYHHNEQSRIKIELDITSSGPGVYRVYNNNGTFIGEATFGKGTFYTSEPGLIFVQLEIPAAYEDTSYSTRSIKITPADNKLYLNDTINTNQIINKDYTFNYFAKGIIDAFSLKVVTNHFEKTVKFYHETDVKLDNGEHPESFFSKQVEKLSIDCKESSISFVNPKQISTISYGWKESNDEYIDSKELDKEEPLYGRVVELNEEGEKKEYRNKFFEPTANRPFIGEFEKMAVMISPDSETYEIRPRILRALPVVPNTSGRYEGGYLAITTMDGKDILNTSKSNLMYGYRVDDIYNMFLKNKHRRLTSKKHSAKIRIHTSDLISFNFRKTYLVNEGTGSYVGYIGSVVSNDCNDGFVDVVIYPIDNEVCSGGKCNDPCDCVKKRCLYYTDYNPTLYPDSVGTVTSFIVNGVQLLSAPITTPSPLSYILQSGAGFVYYTALVDLLNTVGAEFFEFEYGSIIQGKSFMFITFPVCYTFEIRHSINSGQNSSFVINQDGVWYDDNGTLVPILYDLGVPLFCVTYDASNPSAICINTPMIDAQYTSVSPTNNTEVTPYNEDLLVNGIGFVDNVVSDILEYNRPDIDSNWYPIISNKVPYCIAQASVGFAYNISYTSTKALLILEDIQNCDGSYVDKIEYIYGDGTSDVYTNVFIHNDIIGITPDDWDSWNKSLIIKISTLTPQGTVFRRLTLSSNGQSNFNGSIVTSIYNVKKLYHITVRRTVTYENCDQDVITKVVY